MSDLNKKNLNSLIEQALAIEVEQAKEAGALGFMARALTQATMPHSKVPGNEFTRSNGAFILNMMAPSRVGLPYGSYPRLLMAWLTTEAMRTKERKLNLGHSLSEFMRELDLIPTGGRWGTIPRLKDQSERLFSTAISCYYQNDSTHAHEGFMLTDKYSLWWNPRNPDQDVLWRSTVTLSERFFNEVTTSAVPIDMRALKALKQSPLALDIYCWLTHRMSYLSKKTEIPWPALQVQFGSGYATDAQGVRDFKKAFLRQFKKVDMVYPTKTSEGNYGLVLKPSPTHIPRLT